MREVVHAYSSFLRFWPLLVHLRLAFFRLHVRSPPGACSCIWQDTPSPAALFRSHAAFAAALQEQGWLKGDLLDEVTQARRKQLACLKEHALRSTSKSALEKFPLCFQRRSFRERLSRQLQQLQRSFMDACAGLGGRGLKKRFKSLGKRWTRSSTAASSKELEGKKTVQLKAGLRNLQGGFRESLKEGLPGGPPRLKRGLKGRLQGGFKGGGLKGFHPGGFKGGLSPPLSKGGGPSSEAERLLMGGFKEA